MAACNRWDPTPNGDAIADAPLDDLSDAALLRRSGQDAEAFGVFYDRHVETVLGFFFRRTADAQAAADLTAETFAEAFASRHRYRDTGAPTRAWLFGIARHQLSRLFRRRRVDDGARRRLGVPPISLDDESIRRIEELVDLEPLRDALVVALEDLSPNLAAAVVLRVAHELPYAEVARRLGCSEGAARVRVARGLSQLAEVMDAP